MKKLVTMCFDEAQPKIQFPRETRCILLLNERKKERKAIDAEGNETEVIITIYEYDGTSIDVTAPTEEAVLEALKRKVCKQIDEFDTSDSVNAFTMDGNKMWLPKETRVGLMNSLNIEKNSGKTTTVLWFGSESYALGIDTALQMLSALELYALECYNVTASHKADVEALTTLEEVAAYDFESGYPEKLNF